MILTLSGEALFAAPDSLYTQSAVNRHDNMLKADSGNIIDLFLSDFSAGLSDFGYAGKRAISPAKGWMVPGLCFTAGIGTAYIFDNDIRDAVKKEHTPARDDYFSFVNNFGNVIPVTATIGVLYFGGLAVGSYDIRTTGRQLFESIVLSGIVTQLGKVLIGRSRPYVGEGKFEFRFMSFQDKYNSFPSGHSTLVFAAATVFSRKIDRWWAYPFFYGAAASTAGARIYLDKHWASDVTAGAIIGTVSALTILEAETAITDSNLQGFHFMASPLGLSIAYNF